MVVYYQEGSGAWESSPTRWASGLVTGAITPVKGVITLLVTGRRPTFVARQSLLSDSGGH